MSDATKLEIVAGLELRLMELDKLFKNCMNAGQKEAAESIAASVRICNAAKAQYA